MRAPSTPLPPILRVSPETWNAAFVQPSRRPDRRLLWREPNRFQHYYQYQVISEARFRWTRSSSYLGSLAAIGVDMSLHDIRLSRTIKSPDARRNGGWPVWCDGMEVTQFTYFQQMGGYDCKAGGGRTDLIAERLAMYIQNVEHRPRPRFNDEGERMATCSSKTSAMSTWNFEVANTSTPCSTVPQGGGGVVRTTLAAKLLPIAPGRAGDRGELHIFNSAQCARRDLGGGAAGPYRPRVRDLAKAKAAQRIE